jgi:protein arginine kinase activator
MRPVARVDTIRTVKCDRCENEATVHEVRIEAGKRREKHLCEQCARAEGVAAPQTPAPITTLLSNFMLQQNEAAAVPTPPTPSQAAALSTPCAGCGTTYGQFRQNGLLGCPTCYSQFENQLVPLLARAHEGGTSHIGKVPRRLVASGSVPAATSPAPPPPAERVTAPKVDPQAVARALVQRIAMLKKRLAEAIADEEYEKAAKLRDELVRLEGTPQTGMLPTPPVAKRKPRSAAEHPPHNVEPPEPPAHPGPEGAP